MNILKRLIIVCALFFLIVNVYSSELAITEICIEDTRDRWPSWIEIRNIFTDKIDLNGFKLSNGENIIYEINEELILVPEAYIIVAIYKGEKTSPAFEKELPVGAKVLNILNSDLFKEKPSAFQEDKIEYLNKLAKTLKLRDAKEIIGDGQEAVEIENMDDVYPYYSYCLLECQPDLYKLYESVAQEHCSKHKLPMSSKPIFIYSLFSSSLYSGKIAIMSSSGEEKASVSWTNGMYSKVQSDIKISRDVYLIKAGSRYLGYERKWLHHSFSPFYVVLSEYHSSPGKEQNIRPFKDLKLEVSNDHPPVADTYELRLTFEYVISFLPFPWGYEFEIASDKDFKNVLFKKEEKPVDRNPTLAHFYFRFTTADYENLILWNPELFYRARRVLPDGYKTEWAGGECGTLLRKRYNNQKQHQDIVKLHEFIDEQIMPLQKEKKELEDANKKLAESLKKEKNKTKADELRKKIEENEKKINDLTLTLEKNYAESSRMDDALRRKYNRWPYEKKETSSGK